MRLSELAGMELPDISLRDREGIVTGKGSRQCLVRFGYETARALDRYLRERQRHSLARLPRLRLGIHNRGPMTASGVYRMVCRRGASR